MKKILLSLLCIGLIAGCARSTPEPTATYTSVPDALPTEASLEPMVTPTDQIVAPPPEPPPSGPLTERPGHINVDMSGGTVYAEYIFRSFLQMPIAMTWGPDEHLYVADWAGRHVVRVAPDGTMDDLGLWRTVPYVQGDGARGVAFDSHGNLFVNNNGAIFQVDPAGQVSNMREVEFGPIGDIAIGPDDQLYYSAPGVGEVRRLDPSGETERIASGIPDAGFMVFGLDGTLYVSQTWRNRVVRVDVTTGEVSEFASGNFANDPIFVAVDGDGDIWVRGLNELHQYAPDGTEKNFTVDGQSYPGGRYNWHTSAGLAFDDNGGLWFASYNSRLTYYEPTGDPNTTEDFLSTSLEFGFESSDLAVGPQGEIYSSDSVGQVIWRFNPDGSSEVVMEVGSRGRTAVAVDGEGILFVGLPWGMIAKVDPQGNASDYASLLVHRMVFGGDGALYAAVGNFGQPKTIVRITGPETYTVIADSIAGTPLGTREVHLSPAGEDGLYVLTESNQTLYRIGFDGQGEMIADLSVHSSGGPSVMAASPVTGEVFFLSHGPYKLIGRSVDGRTRTIARHVFGDPWGIVVSADGEWLYLAESGAIDKIRIAEP